jgi:hypothetical protein
LGINYLENHKKWKLSINTFDALTSNSKILQDYNITAGSLDLHKNINDKEMNFVANIKYPYKLLVEKNEPVEEYLIKGKINSQTQKTSININNSVQISMDKEIKIKIKDTGINVNAFIDLYHNLKSDSNSSDSNNSQSKNIVLSAKNSYLYISKERHVVSDNLYMRYANSSLIAQFTHADAKAEIKLQNDELHVYGENFNDVFMENLFVLSKFKGGSFDFSIDGSLNEYDGLFYIRDTTILDYKILNNVLAFVNTIPSLVTFSLPGYSSKGLKTESAYIHFHAKDNIFDISDINLDSQEIDIVGKGSANLNNNDINLLLNLKTDLGSSISKVPVVGYILLDGNTMATTVSVRGALDNPEVQSLMAKDIVIAPLNIIKRVIMLPYHLLKDDTNSSATED